MSRALASPERNVGCVLDVESVLDPDVFALVSNKTNGGYNRSALQRTVCASVLTFAEDEPHGDLEVLGIQTFHLGLLSEVELLAAIDICLPDPGNKGARLVTYNGRAHDVVVLRQRAERLWLFNLQRLRGWDIERDRHVDLIYHYGQHSQRRPSLADVAALLGTSIRTLACSQNIAASARARDWDPVVRRNQVDVAATFLAYGHARAWQRGCARPAASAWVSLANWARGLKERSSHLGDFSHHQLVDHATVRLSASKDGREPCGCGAVAG
ncbi:MAG TPA: ribonuclease H-like domain-containing protein [Allosphingosinicella sp.]|jgi:hypothetical protein